ncbi:MAG: hypothetical protein HKN29_12950 [Rhodothermales bacterium]|nr:hypothetical protein [Rhodothermales bacterium]
MGAATEYYIPLLHPLVVHFPIVLLLVAAGMVVIWSVRDRDGWLRMACGFAWLGSVAAVVASRTGEQLEEEVRGTPMVETLIDLHELSADWTVLLAFCLSLVLTTLLFGARWWPNRAGSPGAIRLLVLLLAIAVAVLIAWTGHLGGLMVWGVPR